ncbi:unnamed protein product [Microthlaspi erraticum]|uniref:Uncharacterized protein n=1 Tax=Microthlaspi erraticum TaxID=1685480 RepID=A0A6D2IV89_9BRAS|nr:unnamed protein product [Microthlaspi erraticum]
MENIKHAAWPMPQGPSVSPISDEAFPANALINDRSKREEKMRYMEEGVTWARILASPTTTTTTTTAAAATTAASATTAAASTTNTHSYFSTTSYRMRPRKNLRRSLA